MQLYSRDLTRLVSGLQADKHGSVGGISRNDDVSQTDPFEHIVQIKR